MAIVRISDGSNSVDVDLVYNYVADNTWSCLPGYFAASSGTWTSSRVAKRMIFRDEEGHQLFFLDGVDIKSSWGYPFTGIAGTSGAGLVLRQGGLLTGPIGWEFTSA